MVRTFLRVGGCARSNTCSTLDHMFDRTSDRAGAPADLQPLSVVPVRQGSNKEPTAGQGGRPLPQEVPMSTMTIHEVRLVPRPTSRPAVRRVERQPSTQPSTLRLTRRGRVVVLLLGLAAGAWPRASSWAPARSRPSAPAPPSPRASSRSAPATPCGASPSTRLPPPARTTSAPWSTASSGSTRSTPAWCWPASGCGCPEVSVVVSRLGPGGPHTSTTEDRRLRQPTRPRLANRGRRGAGPPVPPFAVLRPSRAVVQVRWRMPKKSASLLAE